MKFTASQESSRWDGMTLAELRQFVLMTEHFPEDIVPEIKYIDVEGATYEPTVRALREIEAKVE